MLQTHTDFDQAENERLQRAMEEIETLRAALKFYADEKHYEMAKMQGGLYFERLLDRGEKAREALEGS